MNNSPSNGKTSSQPISPGDEIRRPPHIPDHELLVRIGAGSYGEVWLARNIMGTYRAIKVVYRHTFEHDRPYEREFDGIRRFEPISRAHESQLDILHVGRNDQAGYFYYVMELADNAAPRTASSTPADGVPAGADVPERRLLEPGSYVPQTLRRELQRRGRFPLDECLRIGLSLTSALEHLHSHGLVHRDIKPSNVIFVHGIPKLVDLGLVAAVGKTISFVGTEGYLPPEGPGTPQADLYSLGKVLYEISTGKDRLEFPELPTVWESTAEETGLVEFNEVLLKACQVDPRKRYASAQAMRADLLLLQSGKSVARLRRLERRLGLITRLSVAALALALIAFAGLYTTRQVQKIMRQQLAQLYGTNGQRLADEGDPLGSLLWFTEALRLDADRAEREEMHRTRIASVLRQCPRLRHLWTHSNTVNHVEFSPNGRWVVTGSQDHTALVWDVQTGQPVTPPLVHGNQVNHATFSPDSSRVVTSSSDSTARIWDVITGKPVGLVLPHVGSVRHAEFSPDGNRVLTTGAAFSNRTQPGSIPVWDAYTGQPLMILVTEHNPVELATFSPDGRRILTIGGDNTACLWDAATGKSTAPPLRHPGLLQHAGFSPDGFRVVTATQLPDASVRIWHAFTGELILPPMHQGNRLGSVAFSPDGCYVLCSSIDYDSRIWDAATGNPITVLIKYGYCASHAIFSPDSRRILTANMDQTVRLCNAVTGQLVLPPLKHRVRVLKTAFSPDGTRVVAADSEGLVYLWDLAPESAGFLALDHPHELKTARFSPDGRRVVTMSADGAARVWDSRNGRLCFPPLWHSAPARYGRAPVVFSSDGAHFMTRFRIAQELEAILWDTASGKPMNTPLRLPDELASSLVRREEVFPDGRRLVAMGTNVVQVWDVATGKPASPPLKHAAAVLWVAVAPEGQRLLTLCQDKTAIIWQVHTGERIGQPFVYPKAMLTRAAFSPEGQRVVVAADDQTAHVWEAKTGQLIASMVGHNAPIMIVSFSPDGSLVLTDCTDGTAGVWDAVTGKLALPFLKRPVPFWWSRETVFSPDSRMILTGSQAGLCHVWDAKTGALLTPSRREGYQMTSADLSPDSRRLVMACSDGKARFWELGKDDRPLADLLLLARFLNGHYIDANGGLVAEDVAALTNAWRQLQAKYPQEFGSHAAAVRGWQQHEAEDAMQAKQWWAALFHWGNLIQAQPDNWTYWCGRGRAYAEMTNWSKAAADFSKAIELEAADTRVWVSLALAQLAQGDTIRFRRACHELLQRPDKESNPYMASDIAWTCTLAPDLGTDISQLETLVQRAIAHDPENTDFRLTSSLVLYRARKPSAAAASCSELIDEQKPQPCPTALSLLAMASHQIGLTNQAKQALAAAADAMKTANRAEPAMMTNTGLSWERRIAAQIMLREADALIQGHPQTNHK